MRLFHGSTVTVKRPNIQKGRKATDLGRDFIRQPTLNKQKMGFVEEEQGTERKSNRLCL